MDLWTIIKICFKRWQIVVPLAMLTAACSVWMGSRVQPTYRAQSSQLLLVPTAGATNGNPFLSFSGSLNVTGQTLASTLNSKEAKFAITDDGLLETFSVWLDPNAPMVNVLVEGAEPLAVTKTARRLTQEIDVRLALMQEGSGAPAETRIRAQMVRGPAAVEVLTGSRMRSMAMTAAVGWLLTVGIAVAVESVAIARDRKREVQLTAVGESGGDDAGTRPAVRATDGRTPVADPVASRPQRLSRVRRL